VPGAIYTATVAAVGLLPTTSARGGVSYRVRLRLAAGTLDNDEPAPQPRPGMSAVAKLQVRKSADTTAVPAAAIIRDGNKDAVWVIERGEARRRQVTLGAQGEDLVEITDGVRVGDRIVVGGADRVKVGQELR
jgi:HlyD family secretion protein